MNTFGLVFILAGILLGRQVVTGRVKETPQDIRDLTLAVLSGDFSSAKSTLSQRGKNVSPDVTATVAGGTSGGTATLLTQGLTGDLLAKCIELGSKAKGYVWGATGPTYYDCSGLIYRALTDLGLYSGGRFTTQTFVQAMGSKVTAVTSPQIGDVVLWPLHHIGVVSGNDQMYSAMSPKLGIGYSPISSSGIPGKPLYYRLAAIPTVGSN